jgi:homoserine kinase type II
MAVYTDVAADELAEFLGDYDIGELLSYKGPSPRRREFQLSCAHQQGRSILTLYEKRVAGTTCRYFLSLMTHLAEHGINCPQPAKNKARGLASCRPPAAIINFLEGIWPRRAERAHCAGVVRRWPNASGGARFRDVAANRCRFGWRPLFDPPHARRQGQPACAHFIARELELEARLAENCRRGNPCRSVSRQRVLPRRQALGLIDFPFSCNDILAYDVAICLNAWCFEPDHSFNVTKARALLNAYGRDRTCRAERTDALPLLARGAALRFLLTRLVDFLNVPPGALVKPKDRWNMSASCASSRASQA